MAGRGDGGHALQLLLVSCRGKAADSLSGGFSLNWRRVLCLNESCGHKWRSNHV